MLTIKIQYNELDQKGIRAGVQRPYNRRREAQKRHGLRSQVQETSLPPYFLPLLFSQILGSSGNDAARLSQHLLCDLGEVT